MESNITAYFLGGPCTGTGEGEKLSVNFLVAQGYKCQASYILIRYQNMLDINKSLYCLC